MATGKITVAAVNKKGVVTEQQTAFNRSLERASSFTQRTDERALSTIQRNQAVAGQSLLDSMTRVAEQTDRANAQFLSSRFQNFRESQDFQNQQFLRRGQRALDQDKQTTNLNNSLEQSARAFNRESKEKTLEGLAKLSGKVGEIIEDRVKEYNKGQFDEAYQNALMRGFDLDPESLKTFAQAEDALASAAVREGQDNAELAKVDIVQAEDQRKNSPVLKGWAAYGDAKGRVAVVSANWQTAIDLFMESEDPLIPDPTNPNGGLISPKALSQRGPAETMAALQAGTTFLLKQFGVQGINPAILAKDLLPQVQASNANLARQIIARNRKAEMDEKEWKTISDIPIMLQSVPEGDYVGFTRGMNKSVNDLMVATGKGRTEANNTVIRAAISYALSRNDADLLGALSMTDISEEHPDRGTWETHYGDLFHSAVEELDRRETKLEAEQEQAMNDLVPRIGLQLQDRLIAAGTPEETKAAYDWAKQALRSLADQGSKAAINQLQQLNETPDTDNQFYGEKLTEYYKANPNEIPHEVVLKEMVEKGQIDASQARLIEEYREKDTTTPRLKALTADVKAAATLAITNRFKDAGFHSMAELGGLGPGSVSLLESRLMAELEAKIRADPDATPAELMDFAEKRAEAISLSEGAFNFRKNKDTNRPERMGSLADGSVRVPGSNPLTGDPIDRSKALPGDLSSGDVSSNIVMNGEELDSLIDQVTKGQSIGGRAAAIGQQTGLAPIEVVERQEQLRSGNPDYKIPDPEYDNASAIAPREANMMRNPNTPPRRMSVTMQRLAQMSNLQSLRADAAAARSSLWTSGAALGPGVGGSGTAGDMASRGGGDIVSAMAPVISLMEYESGNSYTAYNTGRPQAASANPLNIDLSKMTVGQVRKMQADGDLHATGRYQIIGKTLTSVMAEAGVSDKDLYDKNTQDKLGVALMLRRPALGKYLRGESNNINGAMDDFAMEWAAGVTSSGRAYYNHGGAIPIGRQQAALREARNRYQAMNDRQLASSSGVGGGGEISLGAIVPPGLDVHYSTGPHLDIAVVRDPDGKREFINPLQVLPLLEGLYADGKPVVQGGKINSDFPITSGWGPRDIGGGASNYHRAIDLGIPAGAKITWRGAGKLVARNDSLWIDLPNGKSIRILHTIDKRTSKPYTG